MEATLRKALKTWKLVTGGTVLDQENFDGEN